MFDYRAVVANDCALAVRSSAVTTELPDFGRLASLPRVALAHTPTPVEALPNLSRSQGGAQLFVKRDDCTGLAFGGNKARQLEFYFGEALARDADTVLITGAVQSNFVRMAAAAANKLGMLCHIQHEARVASDDPLYHESGNVFLDRLLGATLHSFPTGEDEQGADRQLERLADSLRQSGRQPYIIPLGQSHPPIGALGYVLAAHELCQQMDELKLPLDEVVVASGSGATHAGLLFGLRALGSSLRVTGVCVRRNANLQRPRILETCKRIGELLEIDNPVNDEHVHLIDEHLAPGYGVINDTTLRAIAAGAREESLMLDPVYTGKAFAGLLSRAAAATDSGLLFLHTGGTPALFAYQRLLDPALSIDDAFDKEP